MAEQILTFSIFGDTFNLDELTKLLNIQPTQTYKKGDLGKYTHYKETSWDYTFKVDGYDLEILNTNILNLFQEKKDLINNFKKVNNLTATIFIKYTVENSIFPILSLNNSFLKFLVDLDCEIDIDGYLL